MPLDADLHDWVRSHVPPPPLRVLEIGAGTGELAAALREAGYAVAAIDPAGGTEGVEPVALADLEAADGSFDAAIAVVALHHVEPLTASLEALFRVLAPGAPLIVDELDVDRVDERAAAWLIAHSEREQSESPAALIAGVRAHIPPLSELRAALGAAGFELGPVTSGAYLYRWHSPASGEDEERAGIAADELPAVGARFIARRAG